MRHLSPACSKGEKPDKAALLSSVLLNVARSGTKVPIGSSGEEMEILVLPTPRWPDMIVAYHPKKRIIFSSKLFAGHVAPAVASEAAEVRTA